MKRLKELRLQHKLTQKDIADILTISRPAYTNYETGKRNLDNGALLKLSEFYNVSTDYLLGLEEPAQIEKSPSEPDERLKALMKLKLSDSFVEKYSLMSEQDIERLEAYMDGMLANKDIRSGKNL